MNPSTVSIRLSLLLLALHAAPAIAAQGIRVSAPLRHEGYPSETAGSPNLSPDDWIVYFANPEELDRFELFSAPADASAPPRKLSGPIVPGLVLRPIRLAFGGGRVVYAADQGSVRELYSVPVDGSAAPVKVSGALVAGGDVLESFAVAGGRVVFVADANTDERFALFSAPLDGSAARINLSGTLVSDGDVYETFRVSPDGSTVAFLADKQTDTKQELWTAPAAGGSPPVKRNGPLVPFYGDVSLVFEFEPVGLGLLYMADQDTDEVRELYRSAFPGAPTPRLSGPMVAGGDVGEGLFPLDGFRVSSDGTRVVYRADQEVDGAFELFGVPIDGGAAVRLNAALPPGGDVGRIFAIHPVDAWVVYTADQAADGLTELFRAPLDGSSAPLRLNPTLVPGGDVDLYSFQIASDGARVVYSADQEVDGVLDLWSVRLDGTDVRKLDSALVPGGAVWPDFSLTADGTRVVYEADQRMDDVQELWSVPTDGSAEPVRLSGAMGTLGDIATGRAVALTSDSRHVVYHADQEIDELFGLWSVPIDGGAAPVALHVPLDPSPTVGDVSQFAWSADGRHLVYSADEEEDQTRGAFIGVYTARLADRLEDGIPVIRLGSGDVPGPAFELSDAGGLVGFREELWHKPETDITGLVAITSIGGRGARVPVEELFGIAERFRFSPDGARVVVYQSWGYTTPGYGQGLYSAPSDGSGPLVWLSEPPGLHADLAVERFALDPAGTRVVFEQRYAGTHLYSAPLDGSLPAVDLIAPLLDPEQDVLAFELVPEFSVVVFVADPSAPGVFELFRSPLAGGPPAVRLSAAPPPGGAVDAGFRVTAGGGRVVYVADHATDDVFELWSVPLDPAGQTPVRLSDTSVPGGGVALAAPRLVEDGTHEPWPQFELSGDGARVVYRADHGIDEVFELFSSPSDGSVPPVRLHPPLAPAQDVALFGFRLTPDGQDVVFAADLDAAGELALYRAPADGSEPPLRICGAFVPGGGLWTRPSDGAAQSFALTPDGATVVFLADARTDEVIELFAAPLDGSRPRRALNAPLVAGGDVSRPDPASWTAPFALDPDGRRVVYVADQESDEVYELFMSALEAPRVRRAQ